VCTLYRLGSNSHDPSALWLSYEWDSLDNREWRQCVEAFLREVGACGHEVVAVAVPEHTLGEDFIELVYTISDSRTTFMSDHLLSLITISSERPQVLRDIWETLGGRMGWAN